MDNNLLEDISMGKHPGEPLDKMNLLALLPCPLKVPLQNAFNEFLQGETCRCRERFNYLIESNANNQLSYYNHVEQFDDIDRIPDIVISPGINSFYYKSFKDKFIDRGIFTDAADYIPNSVFSDIGIKDPDKNYTIISMNLLVMVVDKLKLGDMPVPRKWGDLLNRELEKKVAIRGQKDFFCETVLLTIFQKYGIEGIKRFGGSVKYGWHPAQMAKKAGSGSADSPAVSVMPYFYTRTIKYKKNVEIVWPEDGAIVSPVTMLVKAEKAKELKDIIQFFCGAHVGGVCSSASFPALHPDVDNQIPEGAGFNWIGWDFLRNNDMGSLIKEITQTFIHSFAA